MTQRFNAFRCFVAAAGVSLLLGGCASPHDGSVEVQSGQVQNRPAAADPEVPAMPAGRVGVAGPDGNELPGATIDIDASHKRIADVADRMIKVGRELSDDEARAYMVVYGASEVQDESGKLIGYWVERYYTIPEYEQLLASAREVVTKIERDR